MTPRRAIFLDRDGTINVNRPDHVKNLDEFILLPGALPAVCRLAATRLAVFVISNQSVINRGLTSGRAVAAINDNLSDAICALGGRLDGIYVCPHRPDENCQCRKPRPGLLLQAQAEHGLTLAGSYVVGDAVTDVELAEAVGGVPVLVLTGRGRAQLELMPRGQRQRTHIACDLAAAVEWIIQQEESAKK
jgi:D-glycero-D-manno-heptose 1,7-bisphosphate phosphatase